MQNKINAKVWLAIGGFVVILGIVAASLLGGGYTDNNLSSVTERASIMQEESNNEASTPVEALADESLTTQVVESVTVEVEEPAPASEDAMTNTSSPLVTTPAPAPEPAPQPIPEPEPKVAGITKAEVANHAGEASCWTIVNGSVYDITTYVPRHPGGKKQILAICGRDGTSLFEGQHGGESKPERILSGFYLDIVAM